MNAEWHKAHVLPKGASLEVRIAWHREHQKRCACRPIPPKLLADMRRDPATGHHVNEGRNGLLFRTASAHRRILTTESRPPLRQLERRLAPSVLFVEEIGGFARRSPAVRAPRAARRGASDAIVVAARKRGTDREEVLGTRRAGRPVLTYVTRKAYVNGISWCRRKQRRPGRFAPAS